MHYYHRSLQRHVFAAGEEKTLLLKNTALSGRLRATADLFPDLRIVHIVRHPYDSIASLLGMYSVTWARLAPRLARDPESYRGLARLFAGYYRYRLQVLSELDEDQVVDVRFEDLTERPCETVFEIYDRLDLGMTAAFEKSLRDECGRTRKYKSHQQHDLSRFGLTESDIYHMIPDVFEQYEFDVTRSGASETVEGTASYASAH
jgi:hypothetical protein